MRFLDSSAELPAGVVSLARLAGASIVPFSVLPLAPRRWQVTIERPIPPPARAEGSAGEQRILQLLADRWTATLREEAEHWAAVYPMTWRSPE